MNARQNRYEYYQDCIDIDIDEKQDLKQKSESTFDNRHLYPSWLGVYNPKILLQNRSLLGLSGFSNSNCSNFSNGGIFLGKSSNLSLSKDLKISKNLSQLSNERCSL